jgi:hypothetical protein
MPKICVRSFLLFMLAAFVVTEVCRAEDKPATIRIGIIGLDTSHAIAFTEIINGENPPDELAGLKIVAAFPGGSKDMPEASWDRVPGYTKRLQDKGVEIVDSIPALLEKVDAVLLESVDGRPHLEQARPVFEAKKPLFIDKPLAASLADAIAIAELGKKHNVPWFSSSALRFTPEISGLSKSEKVGDVLGCDAYGPCLTVSTHPDLFWYGIHGVETLFTIMGPGCQSVSRVNTPSTDVVTGVWSEDRIGTFRGMRKGKHEFGATAFGSKGVVAHLGFSGYPPLVTEIAKFFKTGKPPIKPEQTLEIFAFMEAAEQSKREGGKSVTLASVMEKAKAEAASRAK